MQWRKLKLSGRKNHRVVAADLVEKISALPMLGQIDPGLVEAMAAEVEWFSVPGGQVLFRQGDLDNSLYIVLSGRLGAFLSNGQKKEVLIRQMVSGETVGEMAMLSAEPRSATVVALRDTELVRLSKSAFEKLVDDHPRTLRFVTDLLVKRLRESPRLETATRPPRTIAVCPVHREVSSAEFVRSLARTFEELGFKATVVDNSSVGQPIDWFNKLELAVDVVLYSADFEMTPWTRLCLRQADRLLLLAVAGRPPAGDALTLDAIMNNPLRAPVELVVLQEGRGAGWSPAMPLLDAVDSTPHHHVRAGVARDLRRLARMLTGRAIGLVLSGGGARGIAHVGVIRALREAGLELDLFGGTSMGAIVAAGAALEWDDYTLREHMRAAFFEDNPITDYTIPLIALVRGRKASRFLREHFSDHRIEDCVYPLFCVSSNLTTSLLKVHRTGPIWLALRASSAIPGVLPPVIDGSEILIDGGLVNNLPIDIMGEMRRGPIVAVDVSSDHSFRATIDEIDRRPIWQLLGHARHGTPNIFTLLFAAGTMGSFAQSRELRKQVALLIEPPLPGMSLMSWKAFDSAVEAGYRETIQVLEKENGSLLPRACWPDSVSALPHRAGLREANGAALASPSGYAND
jgi:NTE family protein